jgi:hypothetical protein
MALPTSGPLSMSDIANEFEAGTSNLSLYTFGSTLPTPTVTSNIELANDFYGQSAVTLIEFDYNSSSASLGGFYACQLEGFEDTAYHNGSGTYPAQGDNVYSDSSGNTPLTSSRSYKYGNGTQSGGYLNIGASGVVSSLGNCK